MVTLGFRSVDRVEVVSGFVPSDLIVPFSSWTLLLLSGFTRTMIQRRL